MRTVMISTGRYSDYRIHGVFEFPVGQSVTDHFEAWKARIGLRDPEEFEDENDVILEKLAADFKIEIDGFSTDDVTVYCAYLKTVTHPIVYEEIQL